MKAIQIKFMGATDTLPSRLKAWSSSGVGLIEQLDYSVNIELQAERLAVRYAGQMGWGTVSISGFGSLPNGDFVATLKEAA